MPRSLRFITVFSVICLVTSLTSPSNSAPKTRTSIGFNTGIGVPVGWWSERWNPSANGEVNIRYEFSAGTGLLLTAGLAKSYYAERTPEQILRESTSRETEPEFAPYGTVTKAYQEGSFKQIPVGFGFYNESLFLGMRSYVSAAMSIYLWKLERSQELSYEIAVPNRTHNQHIYEDNWWDSQDGADVGGQLAIGLLKNIQGMLFVEASLTYQVVSLAKKHAALAYWGQPTRTWSNDRINNDTYSAVNSFTFRVGIRYGR
ncbi:MAG: hypothetical protein V2A61_03965 [Calditrichota bacterium]